MTTNPMAGTLVFLLGGIAAATYLLPFRGVKGWAYETGWLVSVLAGWLAFPLLFDAVVIPDFWNVLGADSFAKAAALQGEKSFLYKKLLAGRELYETELWRKRYPRILDIIAMTNKVDAHNAYWYTCTNNVMCATTGLRVGNKEKVLPTHFLKDNLELEGDPGFVDYEGFNWELKADAPARKVLPNGTRFAEMGLYDSPWRFSPAVKHGEGMSRPRPIRTEFDQGEVRISVISPKGGRWHGLATATPEWREFAYEEVVDMDGDYKVALVGGQGYKTMYDDVRIEGHPEIDGTFDGDDKNFVVSKPFKMKKGEKLRITLKARQYIPDFIRPYWKPLE